MYDIGIENVEIRDSAEFRRREANRNLKRKSWRERAREGERGRERERERGRSKRDKRKEHGIEGERNRE